MEFGLYRQLQWPCRALGWLCVCVCVCRDDMIFDVDTWRHSPSPNLLVEFAGQGYMSEFKVTFWVFRDIWNN